LESEGPRIIQSKATTYATTYFEASHFEAASSFLHKIATRPKILPYTDMIKWIIDNINIADKAFQTSIQTIIGSFITKYLKSMYHIPDPHKVYDKPFLEHFTTDNEEPSDPIK